MLSRIAAAIVPSLGHLTTTSDEEAAPAPGSIVVANHTSLIDPGIVLAALLRHGVEPVVLATAGLWRIPVLRPLLVRGGHVPVHRGSVRAAESLNEAATALRSGRTVLIYAEGGLPPRRTRPRRRPSGSAAGSPVSRWPPTLPSYRSARRAPAVWSPVAP